MHTYIHTHLPKLHTYLKVLAHKAATVPWVISKSLRSNVVVAFVLECVGEMWWSPSERAQMSDCWHWSSELRSIMSHVSGQSRWHLGRTYLQRNACRREQFFMKNQKRLVQSPAKIQQSWGPKSTKLGSKIYQNRLRRRSWTALGAILAQDASKSQEEAENLRKINQK